MKGFAVFVLFGLTACGRQADQKARQLPANPVAITGLVAAHSTMPRKGRGSMHLIAIPTDKAQLDRMLAMGYTIHNDHMHPPGVKQCPFDKEGGSVIQ